MTDVENINRLTLDREHYPVICGLCKETPHSQGLANSARENRQVSKAGFTCLFRNQPFKNAIGVAFRFFG